MFEDELAAFDGTQLTVTEKGRLFLRNIAAPFDTQLSTARGQGGGFSQAT